MEKITDLTFLQSFSGGDNARIQKYVKMYLDSTPALFQSMEKAAQSNDSKQLKSSAHTLKSQVDYMGMRQTKDILKSIEEDALSGAELQIVMPKITRVKEMMTQAETELKTFLSSN